MDHLVYGVPDLQQAIDALERQTGVRAIFGGRHMGRGTHNALLALGGRRYLEIIAVDREQTDASGLLFPELRGLSAPRMIAWAVAVDSIDDAKARARSANLEVVGPLDGSRTQSDGRVLLWNTLRITNAPIEGLPFFITWRKDSAHPSQDSPAGCSLTSFTIEHTDAPHMQRVLKVLGADAHAAITSGPRIRLKASLQTPKGEVELGNL
jgi:hypothetical protein